jgi:hypothetical protein
MLTINSRLAAGTLVLLATLWSTTAGAQVSEGRTVEQPQQSQDTPTDGTPSSNLSGDEDEVIVIYLVEVPRQDGAILHEPPGDDRERSRSGSDSYSSSKPGYDPGFDQTAPDDVPVPRRFGFAAPRVLPSPRFSAPRFAQPRFPRPRFAQPGFAPPRFTPAPRANGTGSGQPRTFAPATGGGQSFFERRQ